MIRTLIVDDEAPARRKLRRLLEAEPSVEIAGEADSGLDAVEKIESLQPRLVFLDVQMPGLDGFGVVEAMQLTPHPEIVFVTAYDQYALKAFEVHAIGYLLKPFDEERFRAVMTRVRETVARPNPQPEALESVLEELRRRQPFPEHLLIRGDGKATLVPVHRIDALEAARNYVIISEGGRTHVSRTTLENILTKLDPRKFSRISRSHAVRLEAIEELQPWTHGEFKVILRGGRELTWTRRYLGNLPDEP